MAYSLLISPNSSSRFFVLCHDNGNNFREHSEQSRVAILLLGEIDLRSTVLDHGLVADVVELISSCSVELIDDVLIDFFGHCCSSLLFFFLKNPL